MADKVLVIRIPEDEYNIAKYGQYGNINVATVRKAIANGTPLLEELEKIKEEIQDLVDFEETCCGNAILGYQCLSIIDNKISELKGENKE